MQFKPVCKLLLTLCIHHVSYSVSAEQPAEGEGEEEEEEKEGKKKKKKGEKEDKKKKTKAPVCRVFLQLCDLIDAFCVTPTTFLKCNIYTQTKVKQQ